MKKTTRRGILAGSAAIAVGIGAFNAQSTEDPKPYEQAREAAVHIDDSSDARALPLNGCVEVVFTSDGKGRSTISEQALRLAGGNPNVAQRYEEILAVQLEGKYGVTDPTQIPEGASTEVCVNLVPDGNTPPPSSNS